MSTLPIRMVITGHVFAEHRVQFAILDPFIKLGDYGLRVLVLVLVYFYVKKVVQIAYKLDATSRVIQRKLLFVVINLRRLSLRVVCYITKHNIPRFIVLDLLLK